MDDITRILSPQQVLAIHANLAELDAIVDQLEDMPDMHYMAVALRRTIERLRKTVMAR